MESKFSISDDDPKIISYLLGEMIKDLRFSSRPFEDAEKLILFLKEKTSKSEEKINFEVVKYGSMCKVSSLVIFAHFGSEKPEDNINYFQIKSIYL